MAINTDELLQVILTPEEVLLKHKIHLLFLYLFLPKKIKKAFKSVTLFCWICQDTTRETQVPYRKQPLSRNYACVPMAADVQTCMPPMTCLFSQSVVSGHHKVTTFESKSLQGTPTFFNPFSNRPVLALRAKYFYFHFFIVAFQDP